jgi:hypothetical protein
MKRIVTTVAILIALIFRSGSDIAKILRQICHDERFQYVAISKGMMNMARFLEVWRGRKENDAENEWSQNSIARC